MPFTCLPVMVFKAYAVRPDRKTVDKITDVLHP